MIDVKNPGIKAVIQFSARDRAALRKAKAAAIQEIHQLNWDVLELDIEVGKLFEDNAFTRVFKKKQAIEKEIRRKQSRVSKLKKEYDIWDQDLDKTSKKRSIK